MPLGKAASACALASAAAPPPLRVIGRPSPWGTGGQGGEALMRACWGLRPLAPAWGQGGEAPETEAVEVRRPWRARRRSRPSPTAPKLLPRKRLGVPSFLNFIASLARQRGLGGFQRGRQHPTLGGFARGPGSLAPVFAYFLQGQKVGAPARPERVEGESKNFKKRKRGSIKPTKQTIKKLHPFPPEKKNPQKQKGAKAAGQRLQKNAAPPFLTLSTAPDLCYNDKRNALFCAAPRSGAAPKNRANRPCAK